MSKLLNVCCFLLIIATPTLQQQQGQPIFYGNPAAFQYSNFAPNTNFGSSSNNNFGSNPQSPAGTVFIPFQSPSQRQPPISPPRREFFSPAQTFPQSSVYQQPPSRFGSSFHQDRLAPPRQQYVQETDYESPSSANIYNRQPARSQVQVHFEHAPSIRLEAPTGRKLKTPEEYNFPRSPDIPQQNLYESNYNRRTTSTTERPTTTRQPSGLRRFKPGTRTQPGLRTNVLTIPKTEETTPRPVRTRPPKNENNGERHRYRVVPQRFRTRPPISILQEPPLESTSPLVSSTTEVYDFSKTTLAENSPPTSPAFRPSPSDYDDTAPEVVSHIIGFIPVTEFTAPSAPTGTGSDYPSAPQTGPEVNNTSDYPSGEDYPVSNPETAPSPQHQNETFEVITMKSQATLVKDDNFKGFIDSALIDITPTISSQKLDEVNTEETGTVSVSVHTAVSKQPQPTTPASPIETQSESILEAPPTPEPKVVVTNSTESWVVVASVQTSRSVSGARFIPFNTGIKQEEIVLPSLTKEKSTTILPSTESTTESTTESPQISSSTESVHDMLDRVQSELSSSILSGGNAPNSYVNVLPSTTSTSTSTSSTTTSTTTTTTTDTPQFERKFSPNRNSNNHQNKNKSRVAQSILDSIQFDDLSTGLLPPGFKPRQGSFRNRPITTTTEKADVTSSTTERSSTTVKKPNTPLVNFEDIGSGLLPPGFKLDSPSESSSAKPQEPISGSRFQVFKPKIKPLAVPGSNHGRPFGGKSLNATTNTNNLSPSNKGTEGVLASLLPPGFKIKPETKSEVALSSLLPPGFKAEPEKVDTSSILADILAKAKESDPDSVPANLLPPGFKPQPVDVSALLPPGFTPETPTSTTPKSSAPHRPGSGTRKPFGAARFTTPQPKVEGGSAPVAGYAGPEMSTPKINKGWPTRATTEFTGWPTPPTTPLSIEKILEMQARTTTSSTSTSSTTTSTTTTTTTTTSRPTTPGVCTSECQLAGTIRVTGGAQWQPELMDRNTEEYRELADKMSNELTKVYEKSDALNKIFRKVWIDGFNKGSVLVDYIVQIDTSQARHLNTQELKKMFHESLHQAPPSTTAAPAEDHTEQEEQETSTPGQIKPRLQLGAFQLDPDFTDFVVLPMVDEATPLPTTDDELLPQWAIAVIVIGLASLLFVIIFGVSVLVNKQQTTQAKPVMLTEAMLNELGKDHMGGLDNMAAVDDLYGMDAVWDQRASAPEPIRFAKRLSKSAGPGSGSLGYDSWRSDWGGFYNNGPAQNPGPGSQRDYYAPPSNASERGRRRPPDYDTNF